MSKKNSYDLGTTTVKVGLFNLSGSLVKLSKREQQIIVPRADRVEQSLFSTLDLVKSCINEITVGIKEIKAISLSVQRGSIVPLSSNGTPLTNLISWMDIRGKPYYIEEIKKR